MNAERLSASVRTVALVLAFTLSAHSLRAQAPASGGDRYRISVLTFGPGGAVFEMFGHNAIRVQDLEAGTDLAYNWGMFSFDDPNFLGRFLSGDTRYWVEAFPTPWLLDVYARQDRQTDEQVLALTASQQRALVENVSRNALPENRFYRYDYFLDNCSTRVRDALDSVLGGSLARRFTTINTELSFRSESVRLTTPSAFAQAGIDIALGAPADRPITAWESMFVPMRLRDYLRDVTVPSADGGITPLVREESVLYSALRTPEPAERRGLALGAWGPIAGVWMLLLVPISAAARRRMRIPAAVMAVLFCGLVGLIGTALAGMWIGSAHEFWYRNLNLLLLSPVGLITAVPAARAILRGVATPIERGLVIAMLASALLVLPLTLFSAQAVAGPLLLILPAHIGFAIAFWRHTRA